jgi:hypothetical protein
MKTLKLHLISSACVLGLLVTAAAQSDAPPATQQSAQPADTNAVALQDTSQPAQTNQAEINARVTVVQDAQSNLDAVIQPGAAGTAAAEAAQGQQAGQATRLFGAGTNLSELVAANQIPPASTNATGGGVKALNLSRMPLQEVLQTLADAAGFVIRSRVPLTGTVSLITTKPMSREDLVKQLNTVLSENLLGAYLQDDGVLRIDTQENIKREHGQVILENHPEKIPETEEIVTQSLPIKYVDANQLAETLRSLLPSGMSLIVSAGGNALVVQDTQAHIHRMAEIIKILDVPLAVSAVVKVYALTNADAKSLATVITAVFQSAGGRGGGGAAVGVGGFGGGGNPIAQMLGLGGGAFGGGAFGGGGGGRGGGGGGGGRGGGGVGGGGVGVINSQGRVSAPPVTATSDDRSNMLVVSATEEQILQIDKLVAAMDVVSAEITEVEVYKLYYADPGETANELAQLFPNTTTATSQQGGGRGGGVQFGAGRGGGGAAAPTASGRQLLQTQVTAVPDYRTASIIVSASKTLMPQIREMIDQLDSDKSGAQGVYAFNVDNIDPSLVQQYLQNLFPSSGTQQRTTTGTGSAVFNRSAVGTTGSSGRTTGTGGTTGTGVGGATGGRTAGGGFGG